MTGYKKLLILIALMLLVICLSLGCSLVSRPEGSVDADAYTMDLNLDTEENILSGTVRIDLTNHTDKPLDKICIRNYAASILERLDAGESRITGAEAEDRKLKIRQRRDPSVLYIHFKKLEPGESMSVKLTYETDIPEWDGILGYHEKDGKTQYLLTYCFPMLSMFDNGRWNENPYTFRGESIYSGVSDYHVKLKIKGEDYTVAATGEESSDGNVTVIEAKDVRDMAIVASDYMEVKTDTAEGIRINNCILKWEGADQYNQFSMDAAKDAVEMYTENIGEYPYEELDVVQCFLDGSGMEYPGLVLIGCPVPWLRQEKAALDETGWFVQPCLLVAHEVAHQWFYAAVGNNQYEEPWLDESFAQYCESGIYGIGRPDSLRRAITAEEEYESSESEYGYEYGLLWDSEADARNEAEMLMNGSGVVAINKSVAWYEKKYRFWKNYDYNYDRQVYTNGAAFLFALRDAMEDEAFRQAMQRYYNIYCLKEAKGEDFLRIIKETNDSEQVQKVIDAFLEF